MIYITQLIYIIEGQEKVFLEFEDVAMPIIARYSGQLLLRIRPVAESIIDKKIDSPYEVHLVSFEREEDFEAFIRDEERKQFLHLKERSIKASVLIKGTRL